MAMVASSTAVETASTVLLQVVPVYWPNTRFRFQHVLTRCRLVTTRLSRPLNKPVTMFYVCYTMLTQNVDVAGDPLIFQ